MPKDILQIAAHLKKLYLSIFNVDEEENDLSELKLHKLLYFAQKRHYQNFGEWLFNDDFEGWVHGPVNRRVRDFHMFLREPNTELTEEEEYTLREIIHEYGIYTPWALRELSHQEKCYQISREGLQEKDKGNRVIKKEDMILDMSIPNDGYVEV